MALLRWFFQGIVTRLAEATRMLPFARPDRSPVGPVRIEPTHSSGPPATRVDEARTMEPQHHVHPSDDEAHRQEKG